MIQSFTWYLETYLMNVWSLNMGRSLNIGNNCHAVNLSFVPRWVDSDHKSKGNFLISGPLIRLLHSSRNRLFITIYSHYAQLPKVFFSTHTSLSCNCNRLFFLFYHIRRCISLVLNEQLFWFKIHQRLYNIMPFFK